MTKRAQEGDISEFSLLLSGFDVIISPSDDIPDAYHVVLEEEGAQVYEADIPVNLDDFEGNNDDLDGSDQLLEEVGQAAIDMFEAERDTLGQGAGALTTEARTKRAYCESMYWEDWYYNLKGTSYEDEATNLLEQYLRTWEPDQYQSDFSEDLYMKQDELYHQMDMLNFERMKTSEPEQVFVLVQSAKKRAFCDHAFLEEYLDMFLNHKLESKAVDLVKQVLDVETQIDNQDNMWEERWKQQEELMRAMEELSMVALQEDLEARTPELEGIEVAPNMAGDLAELMEDVELEEPLEPMEEDEFQTFAKKKAQDNDPDKDTDEEHAETELGEEREGLDPAEYEYSKEFKAGDEITLNKALDITLWGGKSLPLSKGTKGVLDGSYEPDDEMPLVRFFKEDNSTLAVKPVHRSYFSK